MADSLEYAFEPITLKLNDEDFVVELEPTCERRYCDFEPDGYVGSHSDDYGPQCWDTLFEESTDDRISTAPQAEYVYRYISWDRTVMVALSGGQFAKVPSKIAVTSTAVGYHLDGAVLIVDGRAVKARGARICETTAEDKRAIEKERGALGVLAADRAAAAGRQPVGVVALNSDICGVSNPGNRPCKAGTRKKPKRKGRKPATKDEKKDDRAVAEAWDRYRQNEADVNSNRKPTLEAFATTLDKPVKDVDSALERYRKRRTRRNRVSSK
jgi:hypothetical protein